MLRIEEVLDRLMRETQSKNHRELSKALRIPYQTIMSWKRRNVIPFRGCIDFAQKFGISLDYLMLGKPSIPHPDLVFKDHEHASDLLAALNRAGLVLTRKQDGDVRDVTG